MRRKTGKPALAAVTAAALLAGTLPAFAEDGFGAGAVTAGWDVYEEAGWEEPEELLPFQEETEELLPFYEGEKTGENIFSDGEDFADGAVFAGEEVFAAPEGEALEDEEFFPGQENGMQSEAADISLLEPYLQNAVYLTFTGAGVTASSEAVSVEGTKAVIGAAGTYILSGSCADGCVEVAKDAGEVILALNGLSLTALTEGTVPINAKSGTEVKLVLLPGTVNTLTDADHGGAKPKSCLNSGGNLTILGSGSLAVNGNNKNGIKADGTVAIQEGADLSVTSVDHGIAGDVSVIISGGDIKVTAAGDGIRSCPDEAAEDGSNGNVTITGGSFTLNTAGDAVQADHALTIQGGSFSVITNGGSGTALADDADSCKGLKAETLLSVTGGSFDLNCADDGVHCDGEIEVSGGSFQIATGDDAMHAEGNLTLGVQGAADEGLTVDISTCSEGLEGYRVTVLSGNISLVSSDDGINASGDVSSTGTAADGYAINILGGSVFVNAEGDGLDSNGNLTISGGTTVVYGPASNGPSVDNSALDCDGNCQINGGTVFAAGARGMGIRLTGSQPVIQLSGKTFSEGQYINVLDASKTAVYAAKALKTVNSVIFSSPALTQSVGYAAKVTDQALEPGTAAEADESASGGQGGYGPGGRDPWGRDPWDPGQGGQPFPTVTPSPVPSPTSTPVPTATPTPVPTATPTPVPSASVKLNVSSLKMQAGTYTKKVAITEQESWDTVKSWKSSDKAVAKVTSLGTIKAIGAGKCTITLTMNSGAKAKVKVTVQNEEVPASSLTVSADGMVGKKLTLAKGSTAKLSVTLKPFTATSPVTFTSSNPKVASVSAKGKIKARKKGTAKITVSSAGASKVIKVTVQ